MTRSARASRATVVHLGRVLMIPMALLAPPGLARAATLRVKVVSTRGNPVVATVSELSGGSADHVPVRPDGHAVLPYSGTGSLALRVDRTVNGSCQGFGSTKTLSDVVHIAASAISNDAATVVVPTLIPNHHDPSLSSRERLAVGLINQLRRKVGVPPVQISPTMDVAADSHAAWGNTAPFADITARSPHLGFRCYGPTARQADGGWFSPQVSENVDWTRGAGAFSILTARAAFDFWLHEPAHYENMIAPDWRWVGVAFVGGFAVTDFSPTCVARQWDGCASLGYGDPRAADRAPGDPPPAGNPLLSVHIQRLGARILQAVVKIDTQAFLTAGFTLTVREGHRKLGYSQVGRYVYRGFFVSLRFRIRVSRGTAVITVHSLKRGPWRGTTRVVRAVIT
jgi:uncharacterized protein YkwD